MRKGGGKVCPEWGMPNNFPLLPILPDKENILSGFENKPLSTEDMQWILTTYFITKLSVHEMNPSILNSWSLY